MARINKKYIAQLIKLTEEIIKKEVKQLMVALVKTSKIEPMNLLHQIAINKDKIINKRTVLCGHRNLSNHKINGNFKMK